MLFSVFCFLSRWLTFFLRRVSEETAPRGELLQLLLARGGSDPKNRDPGVMTTFFKSGSGSLKLGSGSFQDPDPSKDPDPFRDTELSKESDP